MSHESFGPNFLPPSTRGAPVSADGQARRLGMQVTQLNRGLHIMPNLGHWHYYHNAGAFAVNNAPYQILNRAPRMDTALRSTQFQPQVRVTDPRDGLQGR